MIRLQLVILFMETKDVSEDVSIDVSEDVSIDGSEDVSIDGSIDGSKGYRKI